MCGILGASGKIDKSKAITLAILNQSRGRDSAGVGFFSERGVDYHKIAEEPVKAFTNQLSGALNKGIDGKLFFAHTRWSTHGAVNNDNAHPFESKDGSFVFAHNGVIHNYRQFGSFEVDSQCLEQGIAEKNFTKFSGRMGIVWIDKSGILNLYKHDQELSYALSDGAFYFSSDNKHLEAIGLKAKELKEGKIYRIKNGNIIDAKEVPSPKKWTGWQGGYHQGDSCETYNTWEPEKKEEKDTKPSNLLPAPKSKRDALESHYCEENKHEDCIVLFPSFYSDHILECDCICHEVKIKKDKKAEEAKTN